LTLFPPPRSGGRFETAAGLARIASKNWVYRQYDHRADGSVVVRLDAAVIRIKADSLPQGGAGVRPRKILSR